MTKSIKELVESLSPDPWREEAGFSDHVADAHATLFDPAASESSKIQKLSSWIGKNQSCLFGRIAANKGLLRFCILDESLLSESDATIRDKIQTERTIWDAESFDGHKSGFVLAVLSRRIANALPSVELMELARRICELYLLEDIEIDRIYTDWAFLEKPGPGRMTFKWPAGVNYFSSQADKRWWQDHRIPGGLAFSVNSVGHMVKAGLLAKGMEEINAIFGGSDEDWISSPVDSLEKALDLAMRTIGRASETTSGKATELLPLEGKSLPIECPIKLPDMLSGKNYCSYDAYYDTDVTVPSIYFRPDIDRPADATRQSMDFTYLFHNSIDNPHFITMGTGQRIRSDVDPTGTSSAQKKINRKVKRAEPEVIEIASCERLARALSSRK